MNRSWMPSCSLSHKIFPSHIQVRINQVCIVEELEKIFAKHSLSLPRMQTLVFTYRYFLHRFPELCILAVDAGKPIGCVVCKIDQEDSIQNGEQRMMKTGYIGMLAVQSSYRRRGIGKALVRKVLERMKAMKCESVMLETGM